MKLYLHEGHHHDHDHDHGHDHDHSSEGKEMKTLAALISHWVHHGEDHIDSYREWADKAMEHGREDVADEINEAISLLANANDAFKRAAALMNEGK